MSDPRSAGGLRAALAGRLPLVALPVLLLLLAALPFYLDEFWLRVGFAIFAAVIGAIGLTILVGITGQLSLGHAFFLAVGAISYCWLASEPSKLGSRHLDGLGLPPLVAMVLAVLISGIAGLVFSPVAGRLRGIYLGIASLGLVFVGQHVLNSATPLTGGYNGRRTPDFELFGLKFNDGGTAVLGIPFNRFERLWYLGLVLVALAAWFAYGLLRSRPGRALRAVRDGEIAAAVTGVDVTGYRARAFLVSSMYAGLAGVLYALSIGSVAPESFTVEVSIQYLAIILLGGLGSVGGAMAGAAFVIALPMLLEQYSENLPFLSEPGSGGVTYSEAAKYAYGAAVVLFVLFQPRGLAGIAYSLVARRRGAALRRQRDGRPPGGDSGADGASVTTTVSASTPASAASPG
ncbi:branched-chain amino acid ABC transporter permease [Frankia sp. CNm7]|uniref:Branched-chain amino acid ABC transporter permease n=1 Tax=Frankia nepalensis TaxID=1836974 RepID=A0A937RLN0_9ACTN|nr:branched-chain amino acid ABC transporter permease [Frankia nepalensis]MBL7495288.1 branched-chain amino acid ABC transporter permease [Frankia nepalensis]MBL7512323.1 branched-chain amino acid ABC transporter permease [Frankia nepalensis]MBL7522035.1 branched-chain amino acid ABC transporter permease [Frankia nepalensis]MBL7632622.1 branched-chain amino acid ABC transporter permease [Frankia nepalensis]